MKILVIGASARAAAQSIRRSGHTVAALDLFLDRDLTEIADCEAIQEFPGSILEQAKRWPDYAVLLCGGMENFPELVSELEVRHTIIGPNASQIRELRSLANWKKWADDLAHRDWIRFPETVELDPLTRNTSPIASENRCDTLGSKGPTKWLYKSHRSAGGMKVSRYDGNNFLPVADGYFQRHVAGSSIGITAGCSAQEAKVLGVLQNIALGETGDRDSPFLQPMPYLYAGSIGPIALDSKTESRIANWFWEIASSIRYRGLLQADFIFGDDGMLYLLEFNPRWTASMELIEMSCQTNLIDLQLQLQLADTSAAFVMNWPTPSHDVQVQKQILYATQELTISSETSDAMMNQSRSRAAPSLLVDSLAGWSDVPHAGTQIAAGSPLATVWAIRRTNGDTIDAMQSSKAFTMQDRWREIDDLLETLDGYPACVHTVFTRH